MAFNPAMLASLTNPEAFGAPAVVEARPKISPREKAAIIVRLMLAEGAPLKVTNLPEEMQTELAQQLGKMRRVSRETLKAVVDEFLGELEQVGLSFPGGLEGAISLLDGHMSANAASRGNIMYCKWSGVRINSVQWLACAPRIYLLSASVNAAGTGSNP